MKYALFGTVSEGTLRTDDLLPCFARELDYLLRKQPRSFKRATFRKLINDTQRCLTAYEDDLLAEADFLITELEEALSEFAAPYGYFGTRPGDGAQYGFWVSPSAVDDFDGLRVDDTSEVPRDYRGEVLHVNDHGNATLYVATAPGKPREIWAIV